MFAGVRKEKRSWENPLGYWCVPNGATPEYVPAWDALEMLGYAWMDCADGWADGISKSRKFKAFIKEIREKLANNLETMLDLILKEWNEIEGGEFPFSYGEGCDTHDDMSVVEEFGGQDVIYSIGVEFRQCSDETATMRIDSSKIEFVVPKLVDIMLSFGVCGEDDRTVWLTVPKHKQVIERWIDEIKDAKKILKEVG